MDRIIAGCAQADRDAFVEPSHYLGDILEFELHHQPINPRMHSQTANGGYQAGLTFRELADRWGVSLGFLMRFVADHCRRLELIPDPNRKLSKAELEMEQFTDHLVESYACNPRGLGGSPGEILCHELHCAPVNPRMAQRTVNRGYETGLTFRELAAKWGITTEQLGDLIEVCYEGTE